MLGPATGEDDSHGFGRGGMDAMGGVCYMRQSIIWQVYRMDINIRWRRAAGRRRIAAISRKETSINRRSRGAFTGESVSRKPLRLLSLAATLPYSIGSCLQCPAQVRLLSQHHLTSILLRPNCMSSATQHRASAKPCAVRSIGSTFHNH